MITQSNLGRLLSATNFFFLFALLCASPLLAQLGSTAQSNFISSSAGMTRNNDFSFSINPSLLAYDKKSCASLQTVPSRFGLKELSTYRGLFCYRLSPGFVAAASIASFGGNLYGESTAAIHSGIALTDDASVGLSLNYSQVSAQDYPSLSQLSFSGGMTFALSSGSRVAAAVHNLSRSHLSGGEQTIAQQLLFGFGSELSENFWLDADAIIQLNRKASVQLASKYKVADFLSLRLAFASAPRSAEFDSEISLTGDLSIQMQSHYHDILGFTFGGGISYSW